MGTKQFPCQWAVGRVFGHLYLLLTANTACLLWAFLVGRLKCSLLDHHIIESLIILRVYLYFHSCVLESAPPYVRVGLRENTYIKYIPCPFDLGPSIENLTGPCRFEERRKTKPTQFATLSNLSQTEVVFQDHSQVQNPLGESNPNPITVITRFTMRLTSHV